VTSCKYHKFSND